MAGQGCLPLGLPCCEPTVSHPRLSPYPGPEAFPWDVAWPHALHLQVEQAEAGCPDSVVSEGDATPYGPNIGVNGWSLAGREKVGLQVVCCEAADEVAARWEARLGLPVGARCKGNTGRQPSTLWGGDEKVCWQLVQGAIRGDPADRDGRVASMANEGSIGRGLPQGLSGWPDRGVFPPRHRQGLKHRESSTGHNGIAAMEMGPEFPHGTARGGEGYREGCEVAASGGGNLPIV